MRIRALALLFTLALPHPALGAERRVTIGSVDRLRVEGPYKVTVATGGAAGLTLSGDQGAIDGVEVRSDGGVLAIRSASALARPTLTGGAKPVPVTIALSTPALRSALVVGAAAVTVGAMKGQSVDLSVSGTGTLSVASVDTPRLIATLIGNGALTVAAGQVASARLTSNGGGTLDAGSVQVGDLVTLQEGAGTIRANARFTAQVGNTGLGSVAVAGSPRCTVRSPAGGAVTCGMEGQ